MADEEPITLKEVQVRLGVPQHVLIHLCEKGVIEPDFAETSGRGKRREFSQRNLFEFGVALALRKLELPVATAAFIVRLLRSFSQATRKVLPTFALPDFLIEKQGELVINLFDGGLLVFDARGGGLRKPLLLAANVGGSQSRPRLVNLRELPRNYEARVEIDLTEIAKNTQK